MAVLQGMATPLIAQKRDGRSGIITHAEDQRPKVCLSWSQQPLVALNGFSARAATLSCLQCDGELPV